MAKLFENLTPRRPANTSVVQTSASDLASIASRAQQRQQEILANNPMTGAGSPFPIQQVPGVLPNLLGRGNPLQVQGIEGVTNIVPNQAVQGSQGQQGSPPPSGFQVAPQPDTAPVLPPSGVESQPLDTPYAELTPTQRNRALSSAGVRVSTVAVDPDSGRTWRTHSGAAVMSVDPGPRPDGIPTQVFLAEDGIAAHSVAFQSFTQMGMRARPVTPTGEAGRHPGYVLDWDVPPEERQWFGEVMAFLEPTEMTEIGGRIRVAFDPDHPVNRFFMQNPFGSSKPGPAPFSGGAGPSGAR